MANPPKSPSSTSQAAQVHLDRMTQLAGQKPTDLPGWVYAKGGAPKSK